jgi:hypothetical protein
VPVTHVNENWQGTLSMYFQCDEHDAGYKDEGFFISHTWCANTLLADPFVMDGVPCQWVLGEGPWEWWMGSFVSLPWVLGASTTLEVVSPAICPAPSCSQRS